MADTHSSDLLQVVALLGAAVVVVPIFRRFGLGSVLGYLAAGLLIGPFGLGWLSDPQSILHVAELGVVMLLFVIGLEMEPSRLWSLRRELLGLGVAQVAGCGVLLTGMGVLLGLAPAVAFVAAMGFVLSSTAIVMQILEERGETATQAGQRIVSVLLLEDLCIVPLLATVAWLGPMATEGHPQSRLAGIGIALGSLSALVAAGVWLLNPLFRLLAAAKAREVMTAAALLVVLGAAELMQFGGLSMAMGAFLAGVLLSESSFRHQLEADIEPFRGILLGLFFLAVGMSLDVDVVRRNLLLITAGVVIYTFVKMAGVYGIARMFGAKNCEATTRAALMAQGGEFAFVLYASAAGVGILDGPTHASLNAIVILSMVLTPLSVLALPWVLPKSQLSLEGIDRADGLEGSVLVIGFGRFGQVMCQSLLARGVDVAIIDLDIEMIRSAGDFGFKIYYGDGTRLDVLHASGAHVARIIAVCIDDKKATNRIVELVTHEFPHAKLLVRSYDREHSLQLVGARVDYQIRETFESAMQFGEAALRELGVPDEEAAEIAADVRRRDAERVALEIAGGGLKAGTGMILVNTPKPTPFTPPRRESKPLSESTAEVTRRAASDK